MHSFDSNNSPFGRLVAETLAGQLSRREIMQRGAALGVGASLMSMLVAAGGRRAQAQDASPAAAQEFGWSAVVPEGLRTDLQGQRVNAVLADATSPDRGWIEAVLAMFSEHTGAEANFIPGEVSATDRLAIYNQQLGAGSGDNDVYQIDVIWPGILAAHATDLAAPLADLAALHFPAIVENNTVNGVLVGMPWFTDAGLLYFRTDLLEKYGYEAGPATWAELEEMAQTIMDGERAENPDFQGFVWQGNAYEGLTCNGLEWQYSNGGGQIIEPDGTVSINNPEAAAAFDRAAAWVGGISPSGITTYQEPDSLNVFAAGNAAFLRNWPYAWSVTQDEAAGSPLVGLVGVSPLPMGDGENASNAATLGGWQMMVSKYSPNQDAALEFVKFMCSPELQLSYAVERSHLPTIGSVYDDPQVAEASEFIPRLRDVFEGGAVARPSSVSADLYNSVSIAYFSQLHEVLTGQKDGATAVAEIESELTDIMSDL